MLNQETSVDCLLSPPTATASSRIQSNMDSSPTHEQDEVNHQVMDEDISSDEDVQTPSSGKRNEREEDGGSWSKKKTRSDVWNHYIRLPSNYNRCKCHYCKKDFSCPTKSRTSNLRKHNSGCKAYMAWKAANKSRNQSQIDPDEEGNMSLSKVSAEVFKEATNEMIVLGELPLSFVESLAWKHFCKKAKIEPPVCRKTCTKEIAAMYMARKAEMKKVLGHNKQRLSLTTDIWTAPYTAVSYMLYKTRDDKYLLDLQRVHGPHFLFLDLCVAFLAQQLRVL